MITNMSEFGDGVREEDNEPSENHDDPNADLYNISIGQDLHTEEDMETRRVTELTY